MKPGDRVRLTEDGAVVARYCDSAGSMAMNEGVVKRLGVDGDRVLVGVRRDGSRRIEVWAAGYWEPATD